MNIHENCVIHMTRECLDLCREDGGESGMKWNALSCKEKETFMTKTENFMNCGRWKEEVRVKFRHAEISPDGNYGN